MAPTQEYPHQDGDVTVLGPEIFASKDGAVISWRGENYVRQADQTQAPHDLTPDALYELASSVRDLASALRLETSGRQQTTDPHQQIALCVGPIDADQVGAEVGRVLKKVRRGDAG